MRARALSELSEVMASFGDLLARDPASAEYMVAERFVAGLVAAAQLQVGSRGQRCTQRHLANLAQPRTCAARSPACFDMRQTASS